MGFMDFFKPVPTMDPDEVRSFLAEKRPDAYNLIDVRQPREYERSHLPGAKLIPMAELKDRMDEIDPGKPTITY